MMILRMSFQKEKSKTHLKIPMMAYFSHTKEILPYFRWCYSI